MKLEMPWRAIAAVVLFALLISEPVRAAPVTVPTDVGLGDSYRLVFVTSTLRTATSTDIANYNTYISDAANAVPELAALGTTWTIIGSTASIDARDNTNTNPGVATGVPIYNLNDTRVADDNADLWDAALAAAINYNENGDEVISAGSVWTGTAADGTGGLVLGNPAIGGGAALGLSAATNNLWVYWASSSPGGTARVYGISGVLTNGVPEPHAGLLLAVMTASLAAVRRRRGRAACA